MLTTNIDVTNGLVNGATGIVAHIVHNASNTGSTILVKYDNDACSQSHSLQHQYPGTAAIHPTESSLTLLHAVRYKRLQFPLCVAYGTTIHKRQGKTVKQIVVNMAGRYSAGQAHVAFSRVTDLTGVFITDFD